MHCARAADSEPRQGSARAKCEAAKGAETGTGCAELYDERTLLLCGRPEQPERLFSPDAGDEDVPLLDVSYSKQFFFLSC